MKHVLILNRYDDLFSDYSRYVEHDKFKVSYITLSDKKRFIEPGSCLCVKELDHLCLKDVLNSALDIDRICPIDIVIAHSEYDLDSASAIRESLNIIGAKTEDNNLYRNKVLMKSALSDSKIPFPQFSDISCQDDVYNFIEQFGFPCILKPKVGAASEGVLKIFSFDDLPKFGELRGYQIEQLIEGDIYHIDAIIHDNEYPYFKVSQYINTCFDFRKGIPLGSFTVSDELLNQRLMEFTSSVAKLLNISRQAIHLELIESKGVFYFLEIGGRVGGGEIPFVALYNEDVDLFSLWTKVSLGERVDPIPTKVTGFLMVPNPFSGGYRFSDDFRLNDPNVTFQKFNYKGHNTEFSYDEIPARIHFEGKTSDEVKKSIMNCMAFINKSIIFDSMEEDCCE